MCRTLLILFAATMLVLTQPAWGLHARAWVQEEEKRVQEERAEIERAMAELQVAKQRLHEQIDDALQKGEENRSADAKAQLERIDAKIRAVKERFGRTGEGGERDQPRAEHPEIAAARDQMKHLRVAHGHLMEGGFKDMAEKVAQRAEEIQNAISRHEAQRKEQSARDRQEPDRATRADQIEVIIKELNGAIRQLREDVKQLREEVSGLRERAERQEKSER